MAKDLSVFNLLLRILLNGLREAKVEVLLLRSADIKIIKISAG